MIRVTAHTDPEKPKDLIAVYDDYTPIALDAGAVQIGKHKNAFVVAFIQITEKVSAMLKKMNHDDRIERTHIDRIG